MVSWMKLPPSPSICTSDVTIILRLQKELDAANTDLLRYSLTDHIPPVPTSLSVPSGMVSVQQMPERLQLNARNEGSGFFEQSPNTTNYSFPYSLPWTDTSSEDMSEGGGGGGGEGGGNHLS
ncbi:hypothetical protein TSUD_155880 [Trifolium subterraneum]|uniref:LOB domain-containing protein n=1 Tax=Trifolium subterraneum TaxID=3900 RepID=A0A2Z6N172_TRISU|nr:hypothetical protein TSUD_155880 [Trifolium subterraneum]